MLYFDWTYFLLIPGILLAIWAQARVQGTYKKYSRIASRSGLTGAMMARRLLDAQGLENIPIEPIAGSLTDNYNPETKVLNLSQDVYNSSSIAALGVAAHECGHAIQDLQGYGAMGLRAAIVPAANIGSNLSWPLFLVGLIFSWQPLIYAGIILFSLAVLFTLVTLPVEFNASNRAIAALESDGYMQSDELAGAKAVLSAAALTYVASALSAILQLARLILLSNSRRNRD